MSDYTNTLAAIVKEYVEINKDVNQWILDMISTSPKGEFPRLNCTGY